ncbi:nuclear transport factor 2 family protein [Pseudokineococcus basanitobsidens]|uniref:Nuclear transport factor 2 family protein n=1 Tax=Pseudokineococcus basanitobsidens TaxID=1926649 RepID=A0ABU8RM29_9ACTN
MYHAAVERIARRNFERVNAHDYEPLLAGCAPDIHHRFGGDHALGGQRHDVEHLRAWFHRLARVCPTLQVRVTDVWVTGLPHRTTIVMRWDATQEMPDGSPYLNHGVHVITMRWLKVTAIDANEDSQAVDRALAVIAAHGVDEAAAAPITS